MSNLRSLLEFYVNEVGSKVCQLRSGDEVVRV